MEVWALAGEQRGAVKEALVVILVKRAGDTGLLADCVAAATLAAETAAGASPGSSEVDGNTDVRGSFEGKLTVAELGGGGSPPVVVLRRKAARPGTGLRLNCMGAGGLVNGGRILVGVATSPESRAYGRLSQMARNLCEQLRGALSQ
jgi:hypothetical protein